MAEIDPSARRARASLPWPLLAALAACLLATGCSGDDEATTQSEQQNKDHVWKEQTQAIDKARDVGRQLGEAAAKQREATQ